MHRSSSARPASLVLAGAALLALVFPLAAGAASAKPVVWAHRGGSYVNGKAVYPENTLPGFTATAKKGFALEFDVVLTKDLVPIVIHDETLDRTTVCTGKVRDRTYADIRANCKTDVLGYPGNDAGLPVKKTKATVSLPTVAQVLAVGRKHKVPVSPELKEYAPSGDSAKALAKAITASKIGNKNVIVQSFLPPMLTLFRAELPTVATSQLGLGALDTSIDFAATSKATWVSPQFVAAMNAGFVTKAHAKGLKVTTWTVDRSVDVKRAKKTGVDALITDDPTMARKALGQKAPKTR